MGYSQSPTGRVILGTVPVEVDGSAYFEAPIERLIYFQTLDEDGMAVQSMRSGTYVHPGEHLTCVGCHEDKWKAPSVPAKPLAMQRPASRLEPEVGVSGGLTGDQFCGARGPGRALVNRGRMGAGWGRFQKYGWRERGGVIKLNQEGDR